MILCDAGPLIALIDKDDAHHSRCVDALRRLPPVGLITTWPCLTEAMYFLQSLGGIAAQDQLWAFVANGLVRIDLPAPNEWTRLREEMLNYADTPMDLGDASLVCAAERLGISKVFTLDRHFNAYRIGGSIPFDIIP